MTSNLLCKLAEQTLEAATATVRAAREQETLPVAAGLDADAAHRDWKTCLAEVREVALKLEKTQQGPIKKLRQLRLADSSFATQSQWDAFTEYCKKSAVHGKLHPEIKCLLPMEMPEESVEKRGCRERRREKNKQTAAIDENVVLSHPVYEALSQQG